MTNLYVAGTAVTLPVAFQDEGGNALNLASATYRVIDEEGVEIVPETVFAITLNSITIPSDFNAVTPIDITLVTYDTMDLASTKVASLRVIEFSLTDLTGNILPYSLSYFIAPRDPLVVGLNSFQTLNLAKMNSMFVGNLSAWNDATDQQKVLALMEAKYRLCTYRYTNITLGQSYLNKAIEIGDVSLLAPSEFKSLTQRFLNALRFAQIAEADSILSGGDPTEKARLSGLLSQKIGETYETYGKEQPVDRRVSKGALLFVAKFLSNSYRTSRG